MKRDELFQNISGLHPLPKVIFRLNEALSNPQVNVEFIDRLISNDPVLTAKMMHLVNSAYYSPVDQIKTLRTAIVRLGFNAIKNLATQICAQDILKLRSNLNGFSSEAILNHSIAVRHFCRIITDFLHINDHDQVLSTAAILHDIGLVIEEQLFHHQFITMFQSASPDCGAPTFFELEKREFGFYHYEISSLFCETWKIADAVSAPLQFHHNFADAPDPLKRPAAILNLADICALQLHIGLFYPFWEPKERPVADFLGITAKDFAQIMNSCRNSGLYT